jgi:hypothetical protein
VKRNAVPSLPYIAVFRGGKKVLGVTASFKRMPVVRDGLKLILQHPEVWMGQADSYVLDECEQWLCDICGLFTIPASLSCCHSHFSMQAPGFTLNEDRSQLVPLGNIT